MVVCYGPIVVVCYGPSNCYGRMLWSNCGCIYGHSCSHVMVQLRSYVMVQLLWSHDMVSVVRILRSMLANELKASGNMLLTYSNKIDTNKNHSGINFYAH